MRRKHFLRLNVVLMLIMCLLAGCGASGETAPAEKETASAKQTVGDDQIAIMTVDLTGGYSVDFASGAAYFYKGVPSDENEAIAFAFVITEDEYDEEVTYLTGEPSTKDEVKDLGNGIYTYDGEYFFPTEDGFYIKVAVQEAGRSEAESIYPRFSARSIDF